MHQTTFLIAAPASGSGKTTITCALLQSWKEQGRAVRAFKCGPDYIDPMFHRSVIGIPSRNLDTFFSDDETIKSLYAKGEQEDGITVIEGVMGLYDGIGGTGQEGSAYHLAQVLDVPVVLVLDAHGMGRTIAAVLSGLLSYDTDKRIVGVILNRISPSYYEKLAPILTEECGIAVFGYLAKDQRFALESRHLGLLLPQEVDALGDKLSHIARKLSRTVDTDAILRAAAGCSGPRGERHSPAEKAGCKGTVNISTDSGHPCVQKPDNLSEGRIQEGGTQKSGTRADEGGGRRGQSATDTKERATVIRTGASPLRIAIAQDEAFCFYYEDNLDLLRELGAELVPFSPIHDAHLPQDICGLILGGGYPELKLAELSANESMRTEIRKAIAGGLPSIAECGGFLYLHDYAEDAEGRRYDLAGVVPGGCRGAGHLVRFGYVTLREKKPVFLPKGAQIRGHEFHYWDSTDNGADALAQKPADTRTWECAHIGKDHWWGFAHLYYPSNPEFVRHFMMQGAKGPS